MSADAELISWLRRTPLYDSTGDSIDGLADEAADRLAALIAERDRLKEALTPFAAIVPSSFYPSDGSENEGYVAFINPDFHDGPVEFTGGDLARARAALSPTQEKGE